METGSVDGELADALRQYAAARFSGVLQVDGLPGGAIYLTDGRISACETSGAPSLEVILLRSRRISESDWDAAFAAAAVAGQQMPDELVQRELLGAGEIEALLRISLADAVYALVSGRVDGWSEKPPADCLLPLAPAARPGWLLAEANRRNQVLGAFLGSAVTAHDRIAAAPGTARANHALGEGRDEILALADGRRTARDLAFALGRGLYETLIQLSRMRADNVVVISSPWKQPPSSGWPAAAADAGADDQTVTGLPRRRKEHPARNLMAIRMLRPRSEGNTMPDET
jgi:hypothetical protein